MFSIIQRSGGERHELAQRSQRLGAGLRGGRRAGICAVLAVSIIGLLGAPRAALSQQRAPDPISQETGPLRPGDSIKLAVWREPDLSGEFGVNESSEVVLPRLGPVSVEGISPDSLKRMLTRAYGEFLVNPSIEVTLRRRLSILGAVRTPGIYPVDPTVTVGDALALAGGASPDGKPDRVELRRGGERIEVKLDRGTQLANTPIRSGDELYVPQKSWIARNPGLVIGTLTGIAGLIVSMATR
jgi:protein involved in polysaccharide export with SLBB domain